MKTLALLSLIWISGCATIISGKHQDVQVISSPNGAKACASGQCVTTPGSLTLRRDTNHSVVVEKDGYISETVLLTSGVGSAVAGNIILGGLIGAGVDMASGAAYKLYPETVNVALRSSTQEAKTATNSQGTAQVNIPDAIKKYFRLTHTKGPIVSVPPSVLSAEYFDNGEGHGAARVTYPGNYVLDGEYRTMAVSQSFKGVVSARLINPDRVIDLPNSTLKGFVMFGGVDGIILECIYASTSDSSKGAGDCADNRGNQYRLDF